VGLLVDLEMKKLYPLLSVLFLIYWGCEEEVVEDTTPPTVTITFSTDDSVSEIVTITCISTDNEGVEKVELWVDGVSTGIIDDTEPYSLDWNTTTLEDGNYTIIIRSYDTNENTTDSEPIVLTVDNTQSNPTSVELYPITYSDGFQISWSQNNDDDFQSYKLFESSSEDMSNQILIYETTEREDTNYVVIDISEDRYYQVTCVDVWGYKSTSNIEVGEYDTTFTSVFGIGTGKKLIQSNDEGYIIGGETYEGGSGLLNYILIKADESGNHETTVMSNDGSRFGDIALTSDNGFVVTGMIYEGNNQAFIKKLDLNGNIEWENYFWTDSIKDIYSIKQTEDLGYILTGKIRTDGNGDVLLIKSDTQGNQLWLKSFDNGGFESANVVHQTSDGGYILMGSGGSFNYSNHKFLLIKTDSDGNEIWRKTFGDNYYAYFKDGKITNDGGFILAGISDDGNDSDIWLIKTDSDGNEEWNNTYGGTYYDGSPYIDNTIDGGYIIHAQTNSHNNGADRDSWLFKVDALGSFEWESFHGDDYNNGIGSVVQSNDGGYAYITHDYIEDSVGASNTRIKLIKTFGN